MLNDKLKMNMNENLIRVEDTMVFISVRSY